MSGDKHHVLIVEDEILVRVGLSEELQDAGYHVVEAADGVSALDVLNGGDRIDLMFTDIRMPGGIDGWDLAERARALRPELPVIYATGYSGENPRLVPGARFFRKPYRVGEILAAIGELCTD